MSLIPALRDPDLIVDEIMSTEADLHDRTVYKSRFERQQSMKHVERMQLCLREAYALRTQCSK